MARHPVNGVLNYVISRHLTAEKYREGLKTGTRAKFHMEVPDYLVLLKYLCDKEGLSVEQAQERFVKMRDASVQAKAKSPTEINMFLGILISVFFSIIPSMILTLIAENSIWMMVVATAMVPTLFMTLLLFLVWAPRKRVMNEIWSGGGSLEERLEKLHEVEEKSLKEVICEYRKSQGVFFLAIALALILGMTSVSFKNANTQQAFHNEMMKVTVSMENTGTRYVVYDDEKGRYVDKYLTDEQKALAADDVRAVFKIEAGKKAVGRYEDQGNAYQRYVVISMIDQKNGNVFARETIYGGEPPRSISVKTGVKNQEGYGSRPSAEEISMALTRMIISFESGR